MLLAGVPAFAVVPLARAGAAGPGAEPAALGRRARPARRLTCRRWSAVPTGGARLCQGPAPGRISSGAESAPIEVLTPVLRCDDRRRGARSPTLYSSLRLNRGAGRRAHLRPAQAPQIAVAQVLALATVEMRRSGRHVAATADPSATSAGGPPSQISTPAYARPPASRRAASRSRTSSERCGYHGVAGRRPPRSHGAVIETTSWSVARKQSSRPGSSNRHQVGDRGVLERSRSWARSWARCPRRPGGSSSSSSVRSQQPLSPPAAADARPTQSCEPARVSASGCRCTTRAADESGPPDRRSTRASRSGLGPRAAPRASRGCRPAHRSACGPPRRRRATLAATTVRRGHARTATRPAGAAAFARSRRRRGRSRPTTLPVTRDRRAAGTDWRKCPPPVVACSRLDVAFRSERTARRRAAVSSPRSGCWGRARSARDRGAGDRVGIGRPSAPGDDRDAREHAARRSAVAAAGQLRHGQGGGRAQAA